MFNKYSGFDKAQKILIEEKYWKYRRQGNGLSYDRYKDYWGGELNHLVFGYLDFEVEENFNFS